MKLPREEVCEVPFDSTRVFDLISDIESYPEFLPWCHGATVSARWEDPKCPGDEIVVADLEIGYGLFSGSFRSKVLLRRSRQEILTEHVSGPFRHLRNHWRLESIGTWESPRTRIYFLIDFSLKDPVLGALMSSFFERAFSRMFRAFQDRAALILKEK